MGDIFPVQFNSFSITGFTDAQQIDRYLDTQRVLVQVTLSSLASQLYGFSADSGSKFTYRLVARCSPRKRMDELLLEGSQSASSSSSSSSAKSSSSDAAIVNVSEAGATRFIHFQHAQIWQILIQTELAEVMHWSKEQVQTEFSKASGASDKLSDADWDLIAKTMVNAGYDPAAIASYLNSVGYDMSAEEIAKRAGMPAPASSTKKSKVSPKPSGKKAQRSLEYDQDVYDETVCAVLHSFRINTKVAFHEFS
jgi:hypothetical protein